MHGGRETRGGIKRSQGRLLTSSQARNRTGIELQREVGLSGDSRLDEAPDPYPARRDPRPPSGGLGGLYLRRNRHAARPLALIQDRTRGECLSTAPGQVTLYGHWLYR